MSPLVFVSIKHCPWHFFLRARLISPFFPLVPTLNFNFLVLRWFLWCYPLAKAASIVKHGQYIFLFIFLGLPIFTKIPPSFATPGERTTFQAVCQAEGFPRPVLNWTRLVMPLLAGETTDKRRNTNNQELKSCWQWLLRLYSLERYRDREGQNWLGSAKTATIRYSITSHAGVFLRLWFNWVQYKTLACETAAFVTLVRILVEVLLLGLFTAFF